MEHHGFYKLLLHFEEAIFDNLSQSVDFEEVGKGRKGNHLVDTVRGSIPLVRTTTQYTKPAHVFSTIHHMILEKVCAEVNNNAEIPSIPLVFNNALIEIYNQEYIKMGYHSDQALDLVNDSYIALFSCYEDPHDLPTSALRKLKVKRKNSEEEFELSLENNSVILFALDTNQQFQHKIVWEPTKGTKAVSPKNRWLGITFRRSKTFIRFEEGKPYFENGTLLTLATDEQAREFFTLRGQENHSINFVYPDIAYTLSVADTMAPLG